MNNKVLYIIGNGFDLHFGIKSKYSDFEDYLKENDNQLYDKLSEYFNNEELWSDFERTLADIDVDSILDYANNFLPSYGADDWSDSGHHDYQYEIDQITSAVTKDLKKIFTDWILQLKIPEKLSLNLPKKAIYLVFNYTDTIEKNTNIPSSNIAYIHNKAVDSNSNLILGHHRKLDADESYSHNNDEDTDPRIAEGNQIIDNYFKESFKDTETVIKENDSFFSKLNHIKRIVVLGHSISEVDIKYFQVIVKQIPKNVKWTVSYYTDESRKSLISSLVNIGVAKKQIETKLIGNILKKKCPLIPRFLCNH